MKSKSSKNGKAKAVTNTQISERIKIDTWFTREEFSMLTGIIKGSCASRLNTLSNGGYFHVSQIRNSNAYEYTMSEEQRLMLIELDKINKAKIKPGKKAAVEIVTYPALDKLAFSTAWV